MIALRTEIKGIDEIVRNIRGLGKDFAKEVELPALKRAAKPIEQAIASDIAANHRESGLTAEDITTVESKDSKQGDVAAVLVGARRGRRGRAFILSWLEFGTFRFPGFHVVGRAFGQHGPAVIPALHRELRASFKRAVRKHTRRAA